MTATHPAIPREPNLYDLCECCFEMVEVAEDSTCRGWMEHTHPSCDLPEPVQHCEHDGWEVGFHRPPVICDGCGQDILPGGRVYRYESLPQELGPDETPLPVDVSAVRDAIDADDLDFGMDLKLTDEEEDALRAIVPAIVDVWAGSNVAHPMSVLRFEDDGMDVIHNAINVAALHDRNRGIGHISGTDSDHEGIIYILGTAYATLIANAVIDVHGADPRWSWRILAMPNARAAA